MLNRRYIKLDSMFSKYNDYTGVYNISNPHLKTLYSEHWNIFICTLYIILHIYILGLLPDRNRRNSERCYPYRQYEDQYNFTGVEFPVKVTSIPRVEAQNNVSCR